MSSYPAAGRPAAGPPWSVPMIQTRPAPASRGGWGWLEWTIIAQTAIPALMFIPGLTPIRPVTRVAAFVIALLAWGVIAVSGRRAAGRTFPAAPWLAVAAGWLALMMFHPYNNSPLAGLAQAALNLAILSPALWGGAALGSPRQVGRLMVLLFLCNAASALVGIGQFYRPDVFNPPVIPVLQSGQAGVEEALTITAADGRTVLRPCGLTDSPGAGSVGGSMACLIGLCLASRPMAGWKRLTCFVLALAGAAVVYLSQVRSVMIGLVLSLVALMGLLALRRDLRRAGTLALGCVLALGAAAAWAARSGGENVIKRFTDLLAENPAKIYDYNRGYFLREAFTEQLPSYPLGAGLGRWGQIYGQFGDPMVSRDRGAIWVEIQWSAWIFDGGAPLVVLYSVALVLGLRDMARLARRCRDEELGFWAAVVGAWGLSIVAFCFASCPFIGPTGVQFWALLAAVHAAGEQARLRLGERGARN